MPWTARNQEPYNMPLNPTFKSKRHLSEDEDFLYPVITWQTQNPLQLEDTNFISAAGTRVSEGSCRLIYTSLQREQYNTTCGQNSDEGLTLSPRLECNGLILASMYPLPPRLKGGFHQVAQADLELLHSSNLPTSASRRAGITGVRHCAPMETLFKSQLFSSGVLRNTVKSPTNTNILVSSDFDTEIYTGHENSMYK
ncbi:Protein GVQW1, partial [Plecturocebus cupreus]